MTDDDPYDKMLDDMAAEYNKPGTVPRDEMWARIQAARSAARREPAAPSTQRWVWPGVGIAALLVLSAGILIGRRMGQTSPAVVAEVNAPPKQPDTASLPLTATPAESIPSTAVDRGSRQLAQRPTDAADSASTALAYRMVLLEHLAGSEAVITAFRNSAKQGAMDPQLSRWSRDLLGTTRMLRASPAGEDPMMARLLDDLDLVLAQIAQYTTHQTNRPDDLDLIEQAITKRGVIAKLRTTIPTRTVSGGNTRGL